MSLEGVSLELPDAGKVPVSALPRRLMRRGEARSSGPALICLNSLEEFGWLLGYRFRMRSFFAALLIVLFAGVHSAAAFDGMKIPAAAGALTEVSAVASNVQLFSSHHAKCCETSGKAGMFAKFSGCSADCVSLHGDFVVLQFQKSATLETIPLAAISGGKPAPHLRPPRNV
ncbi:hypothetical protein [Roseibium litorale]|uniref:Uncharacterized protein n=1 Tax=Roseibium litorale TaxID=2803841 RepID=A0ABR9CNT2_9HYPH|nr:hypothetical protein [Roseibium litorale]MBD8892534.1 hypothetical protein [Roseibium litorale]